MSDPRREVVPPPAAESVSNGQSAETPEPDDHIEVTVNGIRMQVPALFEAAVQRAIKESKRPLPKEMTVNQAADFLDVSREYILKRIKRGELPCRLVGKRRRIPSAALVEYNELLFQRAKAARDEMSNLAQELGLYDEERPLPKME